jgi:hypothetical protein
MWGDIFSGTEKEWLEIATNFTSNHDLYGYWMDRVIRDWPVSCENALTDRYINKKAWIGHAAAARALFIPEYITRKAWRNLTDEQKYLANKRAERAIRTWQNMYIESKKLCKNMEGALL